MIVVLSGEGPTDLGSCGNGQSTCDDGNFQAGPMAVLLDKLMAGQLGYSVREVPGSIRYVSEAGLSDIAQNRKANKRLVSLVGKKHGQETGYFFINAWNLGNAAKSWEHEGNPAVAVLFRDNDPMRSAKGDLWDAKWKSMHEGFQRADFARGIPMVANPKSEAWLLCAAKQQPFQQCGILEDLPGNDISRNSAKLRLAAALGGEKSAAELSEWLEGIEFDAGGASEMRSFRMFYERLQEVLAAVIA